MIDSEWADSSEEGEAENSCCNHDKALHPIRSWHSNKGNYADAERESPVERWMANQTPDSAALR
jgi:hypothetical protein